MTDETDTFMECEHLMDSKMDYRTRTMIHTCRRCGHIELNSLHPINGELETTDAA